MTYVNNLWDGFGIECFAFGLFNVLDVLAGVFGRLTKMRDKAQNTLNALMSVLVHVLVSITKARTKMPGTLGMLLNLLANYLTLWLKTGGKMS